jgi:tetratricopeptide (TPR) repeat protein
MDDDITSDDVAELLTRLADKSLIIVEKDEFDGYARCRLLQTLVDYGRERLESSGDAARVAGAHVRYYADLAVRSMNALHGEKQRGWLTAVTANMDNLRFAFDAARDDGDAETAQAIAGGLGWYWWFTGRAVEGSRWLGLAQACTGPVQDRTRARVMAWAALMRASGFARWIESDRTDADGDEPSRGRLVDDEIDDLSNRAIAIYRRTDALEELAVVESALAVTYSTRGNNVRARDLLIEAEQLLAALPPAPWVASTHAFVVALRAFVEDRYADAELSFRISAELLGGLDADMLCAFALRYSGRLAARRGDYAASVEALERSLQLAQRLSLPAFANVLMTDLADSLAGSGAFERARAILEHPLRAAREVGSGATISESLTALAMVEWRANNVDGAARRAHEGLQVALETGNLETGGHCLAILGYVAESGGRLAEARTCHTRAFHLAREAREPRRVALALEGLAGVALLENDALTAARLLGAATGLRRSPGRAAGWSLATAERIHADRILAGARQILGSAAADRVYNEGEANPDVIIARVAANSPI